MRAHGNATGRLRGVLAGMALALVVSGLGVAGTAGPASAGPVPVVTSGGGHSCALMTDQTVWCWGRNTVGQLGNGTIADSLVPVHVSTLPPAINVSAGHDHTCAVNTSNQAWCWGGNAFGQLGNGTTSQDSTLPVLVQGIAASQVSAGDQFSCAVTLTHTVNCWGDNNYGELGNGTLADSSTPVKVQGLSHSIQSLANGSTHSCALVHNGGAFCWGDNNDGQLGDGTTTNRSTAVAVAGLPLKLVQIAASADHTCAVLTDGTVKCWGQNTYGQLGDGTTSNSSTPVAVTGLTGVLQVALGYGYTCALTSAGAVQCWGDNSSGELGNGSTTGSPVPVQVSGLTGSVVAVGGGTCATLFSGQVDCWGSNASGQLGDGSIGGMSTTPVPVPGFTASSGAPVGTMMMGSTSCALDSSQLPECWGNNDEGELGDGTTISSGTPVVVQGL